MEPLLTLEQVAEVLQVSTKTVLRLIDRGELTGVKVGKAWRFTREDLQLYIDSQRSGGRSGEQA
jgi:excisionase family DNA binding protein